MEKIKFIDVNGQQVVDLTPNYERPLALVDMDVLHRLTKLLPKTDLNEIKRSLKVKISAARSVEDMVLACEEFTAFNTSVNLIKEVFVEFKNKAEMESRIKNYDKLEEPEEAEPELNSYE